MVVSGVWSEKSHQADGFLNSALAHSLPKLVAHSFGWEEEETGGRE